MLFSQLADLHHRAAAVAEEFDPALLTGADAARVVMECGRIERAVTAIRTLAAGRVDATRAWAGTGERSAAHWLARQGGTGVGEAVTTLQTAKELDDLPATKRALQHGELSPRQAHLVTQAASADPTAEQELLEAAKRESLPELRDRSLRTRAAAQAGDLARYRAVKRSRYFRHRTDPDGAWVGTIRDTPDVGALVVAALASERPGIFEAARAAGQRDPSEAYDADAVAEIMRKHVARGNGAEHRPPESPAGGAENRRKTGDPTPLQTGGRRTGSRTALLARVDHDALVRGHCEPGELCEVTGVGPVPVTFVRGLLAHAFLAAVTTSPEGDVVRVAHLGRASQEAREAAEQLAPSCSGAGPPGHVPRSAVFETLGASLKLIVRLSKRAGGRPRERSPGILSASGSERRDAFCAALDEHGVDLRGAAHHTRKFRVHQRTALEFRDPCCAVLGCAATARLELDHREEWAATHTTSADDADRLCHAHHWLKTHRGYRLEPGSGKRRLLPPSSPPSPYPATR